MSKDFEEWKKKSYKQYEETFGEPYNPNKMTEDERKELYEKISEIEDYDPSEEEVDKMYSDEFNKKWDNFTVE